MSPRVRSQSRGRTGSRTARQVSSGPWPREPDRAAGRHDAAAEPDEVVGVGDAEHRVDETTGDAWVAARHQQVAQRDLAGRPAPADPEQRHPTGEPACADHRPVAEQRRAVAPPEVRRGAVRAQCRPRRERREQLGARDLVGEHVGRRVPGGRLHRPAVGRHAGRGDPRHRAEAHGPHRRRQPAHDLPTHLQVPGRLWSFGVLKTKSTPSSRSSSIACSVSRVKMPRPW